jgi:UDP-glucose 4-epimerase
MVKKNEIKKVLLTGAFGNIGLSTLEELLTRDFKVITFDIPRKKNRRIFRKYKNTWGNKITAFWGDLRNYTDVEKAFDDVIAVIHLGANIPPISEKYPDRAFEVNVGGTLNILKAMELKCP